MYIIAIGGNIGCGKSTLIERLKNVYPCYSEPIELWQPWLNMFYKDQQKYALGLQIQILKEYSKLINSAKDKDVVIFERSSLDNIFIFAKNLLESGTLHDFEYDLVKDLHDVLNIPKPDIYIYLKTDPGVCIERIKERSRGCESGIPDEYIHKLHEKYEEFINENHFKTIIIDGNANKETIHNIVINQLVSITNC